MMHVFRNKKISILIVAAIVVALLLVCILLITLSQMTSLNQRAEKLVALIAESREQGAATQELIERMKTDAYVIRWAESNGRISSEDILWISEHLGNN